MLRFDKDNFPPTKPEHVSFSADYEAILSVQLLPAEAPEIGKVVGNLLMANLESKELGTVMTFAEHLIKPLTEGADNNTVIEFYNAVITAAYEEQLQGAQA